MLKSKKWLKVTGMLPPPYLGVSYHLSHQWEEALTQNILCLNFLSELFMWLLFHLQQTSLIVLYLNFQATLAPGVYFGGHLVISHASISFPSVSLGVMDDQLWILALGKQTGLTVPNLVGWQGADLLMPTLTGHHQVMLTHSPLWIKNPSDSILSVYN